MLDATHGGSVPSDDDARYGRLCGVIARSLDGRLCFYPLSADEDPDGVPLDDGIDAIIDAALDAPDNIVTREELRALYTPERDLDDFRCDES